MSGAAVNYDYFTQVNIRLKAKDLAWLREKVESEGTNVSAYLRELIEKHLEEEQQ